MKKIYHLENCSTCQRIIGELGGADQFDLQNIKEENIEESVLDQLKESHGSYEALFSKRAMKYRSLGLNEQQLSEDDYKNWILKEYTFLKRPVMLIGDQSFVGNAKKTVAAAKEALTNG